MAWQFRSNWLLAATPPWMRPRRLAGLDRGFRYLYLFGVLVDTNLEAMQQGVLARFPGIGTPTALPRIGRDRRIRRGFAEDDDTYALRLLRWRSDHKQRGSAHAVLSQLWGYLNPFNVRLRTVLSNANRAVWHTLAEGHATDDGDPVFEVAKHVEAPTNWDWDGVFSRWARLWTVVYPKTSSPALFVERETFADLEATGLTFDEFGGTFDTDATGEQVASMQALIDETRGGHNRSEWILIAFDNSDFDPTSGSGQPDGTWGKWSKDDGTGHRVSSRPLDVSFWDGA